MERVMGLTLRQMLRESESGRIEWIKVVCYAIQMAEGLWVIHRMKMWHRDIKPENVMVNEDGYLQILDFGIARDTAEARPAGITDLIGTPGYLPPEMTWTTVQEQNDVDVPGDPDSPAVVD
jgi:serine/threonine protein kinase